MANKVDVALDDLIKKKDKPHKNKPKGPKPGGVPKPKGLKSQGPSGKFKGKGVNTATSTPTFQRRTAGGGFNSGPQSSGRSLTRTVAGAGARAVGGGGGGGVRITRRIGTSGSGTGGGYAARALRTGGGGGGGRVGFRVPKEEQSIKITSRLGGDDPRPKAGGSFNPRKAQAKSLRASPYAKGNPDAQWAHDLYPAKSRQDDSPPPTRITERVQRMVQPAAESNGAGLAKRALAEAKQKPKAAAPVGTKVLVSNLDFGVTTEDIRELFGSVGPLVRAEVNKDATGRSKGTASVVFVHENDAKAAIKEYAGAILDDKAIQLELAPKVIRKVSSTANASGAFIVVQEDSRKIVKRASGSASDVW